MYVQKNADGTTFQRRETYRADARGDRQPLGLIIRNGDGEWSVVNDVAILRVFERSAPFSSEFGQVLKSAYENQASAAPADSPTFSGVEIEMDGKPYYVIQKHHASGVIDKMLSLVSTAGKRINMTEADLERRLNSVEVGEVKLIRKSSLLVEASYTYNRAGAIVYQAEYVDVALNTDLSPTLFEVPAHLTRKTAATAAEFDRLMDAAIANSK